MDTPLMACAFPQILSSCWSVELELFVDRDTTSVEISWLVMRCTKLDATIYIKYCNMYFYQQVHSVMSNGKEKLAGS